ncbi:MAG: PD40 domain-containing protein, partial [Cytophagaceae bacterium]|nr:PD40 domain-containing protein [Gemmatimonadaceae bacterium]
MRTILLAALLASAPLAAQSRDPLQEGLPLKPTRTVAFTTKVGHWMSLDVSPDGQTLVFDLLGDLYTLPMAGGKATPLTRGMGFDAQPRFSPDGKRVVYVSDRDGGYNLYQLSLDKRDTVQMTRGKTNTYESPDWTPDGKYVVVTRNMKLHLYHADGGTGQQLIREPAPLRTLGAAVSPDGRYIWYHARTGQWLYNTPLGDYDLMVYDRQTGQAATRSSRWGSAMRPTLSPDGRWMVYVTRHIDTTRLRIRDLRSGDERWLVNRVQRDDQESRATLDVYPGMSFTPDSRTLVAWWDGKLWKVPVEGNGAPQEIPFEADVSQAMGPYVEFNYPIADSATFIVKQVRDAVPSPDGARLAFTAMDRLYVMDWPNGTPRRLTTGEAGEFHPAWSPDGQSIAYTSMSARDGGHIQRVASSGGTPQRLTSLSAYYSRPTWTLDSRRLVALRSPFRAYEEAVAGGVGGGNDDIVWIPGTGGEVTVVAPAGGLGNLHFANDSSRLYAYSGQRGLVSMRFDGTDQRTHLRVTNAPAPGGQGAGPAASVITMSPLGDGEAMAQVSGDVFIVTVAQVGGTEPSVVVNAPESSFPVRKLTDIGGQFPTWSRDGRRLHWSIGNAHVVYDLAAGRQFDDSVRATRRGVPADTTRGANRPPAPTFKPFEKRILISAPRDIPQRTMVLRGARLITMKGDEVIANGDIVVRNNRIVGIGARGSVSIPSGARTIDVSGATIVPGYVDTHAHVRATFDVHREQVWSYQANLAYGVTTLRDPQTASTDVLSYEDMVMAGKVVGPRIYSTGPGVFGAGNPQGNNLTSLDQARTVLKRYSQYYDTKTIKQYQVGNREQRQWVIQAANELGLMPTTEGGLDYKMNITEAIDGYSGHEHTIPTFPLQADVIRFLAESKMVYTPTILVAYGGPWAENYWYETEDLLGNEKLKRFT